MSTTKAEISHQETLSTSGPLHRLAPARTASPIPCVVSGLSHDNRPHPTDATSPALEVAIVRELLQVLSADDAQQVLQHIGAALIPGGQLFIIGQILDDTHTTALEAVGFNLIFFNTFYAGESYTEGEHRAWLQAAGFVDAVRAPFLLRDGFGSGLIMAYKGEAAGGARV